MKNNNDEFKEWIQEANNQNNRAVIKKYKTNGWIQYGLMPLTIAVMVLMILVNTVVPIYVWAQDIPVLDVITQTIRFNKVPVNLQDEIKLDEKYVQKLEIEENGVTVKAAAIDPLNVIVFYESNKPEAKEYHLEMNQQMANDGLNLPAELIEGNVYRVTMDLRQSQEINTLELVRDDHRINIPIDFSLVLPLKTVEINESILVDEMSIIIDSLDMGAYTSRLNLTYTNSGDTYLGAPKITTQEGDLVGSFVDNFSLTSQINHVRINQGQLNWDKDLELTFETVEKINQEVHTLNLETKEFSYIPEAFTISDVHEVENGLGFKVTNENDRLWFWSPFTWESNINEFVLECDWPSCDLEVFSMGPTQKEFHYTSNRGDLVEINKTIQIKGEAK